MSLNLSGTKSGERVVAISNSNKDRICIFGYGTYIGDKVLPTDMPSTFGTDEKMLREVSEKHFLGKPKTSIVKTIGSMLDGYKERLSDEELSQFDKQVAEEEEQKTEGTFVYTQDDIDRMVKAGRINPCIELDDGGIVWGCECWWGPVEGFEKTIRGREIITVDLEEYRKEVSKTVKSEGQKSDSDEG